jgi:hypothetical protein
MEISNIANQKGVQNSTTGGKFMMTLFGMHKGQFWNTAERGTTVNSVRYSEMLRDQLKPAIRTKRRGLLSKSVAMLHDNVCPLTVARTVDGLCQLNFVLKHSPYSPNLALSVACLIH